MLYRALSSDLSFHDAFDIWISRRLLDGAGRALTVKYIGRRTEIDYRTCARALEPFFGGMPIGRITPDRIMAYQEARNTNQPHPAGEWRCLKGKAVRGPFPTREAAIACAEKLAGVWEVTQTLWTFRAAANRIRKEVALLLRILRAARLWGEEQKESFLRVQAEECELARALTVDEQHRLLHVASSRADWRLMYQYAIVALQTTASTNELRGLRLGDVFLAPGQRSYIQIPPHAAKNKYRMRTIPLVTRDAEWAMEGLVARARELGSSGPADYLFPIQSKRGKYNPARPMSDSGLKKPWDEVRRAALLPRARLYDLRHTGITRMAEAGVPLAVTMSFAGHMTRRMQEHYQAVCMASQRGWGETVWGDSIGAAAAQRAANVWPEKKPPVSVGNHFGQHIHRRA